MRQDQSQRGGRDAVDTCRLTQSYRADCRQLLRRFARKTVNRAIVELAGQFERLVAPKRADVRVLTVKVAGVACLDLELLHDVWGKLSKLRPNAGEGAKPDVGQAEQGQCRAR